MNGVPGPSFLRAEIARLRRMNAHGPAVPVPVPLPGPGPGPGPQPGSAGSPPALVELHAETIRHVLTAEPTQRGFPPQATTLSLVDVRVLGRLNLNDLRIDLVLCLTGCELPDGVDASYSAIRRLELRSCLVGSESSDRPALNLSFARIDGALDLSGSAFRSGTAPAVDGSSALIAGDLILRYGDRPRPGESDLPRTTCTCRSDSEGAAKFVFTHVDGSFLLNGALISNASGPALNISSAVIGGDLNLSGRCELNGASRLGALEVVTTVVNGQLDLGDSSIFNATGPAANIRGAHIVEDIKAKANFLAAGCSDRGVVRLFQTRVDGRIWLRAITIENRSDQPGEFGPAINGEDLEVGQGFTVEGFGAQESRLIGSGEGGAIRLSGASITGQIALRNVEIKNSSGPALAATRAKAGGLLLRPTSMSGAGARGVVRLAGAHLTGMLRVDQALIRQAVSQHSLWVVDGLTYEEYPDVFEAGQLAQPASVTLPRKSREGASDQSFSAWLDLLRHGTLEYAAQPYQHLAALARGAGHERDSRRALIAQREDQRLRGRLSTWSRWAALLSRITVGYGYKPWRPLIGLAMNVAASLALILLLFPADIQHEPVTAYVLRGSPPSTVVLTPQAAHARCGVGDRILISLDIALPLVRVTGDRNCRIASNAPPALVAGSAILQLLGWAAATLFVAGLSGLIRRA